MKRVHMLAIAIPAAVGLGTPAAAMAAASSRTPEHGKSVSVHPIMDIPQTGSLVCGPDNDICGQVYGTGAWVSAVREKVNHHGHDWKGTFSASWSWAGGFGNVGHYTSTWSSVNSVEFYPNCNISWSARVPTKTSKADIVFMSHTHYSSGKNAYAGVYGAKKKGVGDCKYG
jgi:hypothetical protein